MQLCLKKQDGKVYSVYPDLTLLQKLSDLGLHMPIDVQKFRTFESFLLFCAVKSLFLWKTNSGILFRLCSFLYCKEDDNNMHASVIIPASQDMPASVAQLDVHPTGDLEVVGLTPAGSATFFCGD